MYIIYFLKLKIFVYCNVFYQVRIPPLLYSNQLLKEIKLQVFLQALLNYRKRFTTKKEADSMFLDLYNSGMYLPKVFKFIGTISIGTLHRWVKSYERYENAECLIPQYKFNKQGEYNTILTDEMKHILLRFLLHQQQIIFHHTYTKILLHHKKSSS